jgi:hypothetical protein
MKLIDKLLTANEQDLEWSDVQRENRLRAISGNAMQQGRIPFGRGFDPFTDGDAQAQHDIYLILLRLERKSEVVAEQQHQLLTPVAKPDTDAVLADVANVITHPRDAEFQASDGTMLIRDRRGVDFSGNYTEPSNDAA